MDVHIATTVAKALAALGHEVVRAADGYADWPDERLLDLARSEGFVLVTEDRDFSDLIYLEGAPPPLAILYIRCDPTVQQEIAERLPMILANTIIDGHMVVIQRANVRLRPLPGKSDNG